jgi:hypothetical protein
MVLKRFDHNTLAAVVAALIGLVMIILATREF